jgi:hypothetical protein
LIGYDDGYIELLGDLAKFAAAQREGIKGQKHS